MKNKNLVKSIFRTIIIISATTGFILNSLGSTTPFKQFAYFTLQSNVLVAIVYLVLLLKKEENKVLRIVRNQTVVAIILTGLVYNLMLRPYISGNDYSPDTLSDILVHTLTPILVLLDFLFFSNCQKRRIYEPFYNLIFPMFYWIFTIIFVVLGGNFNGSTYESNYPYFFLNFPESGVGYFILVIVFIIIISFLLYFIEGFISKKLRKKGVENGSI